MLFVCLDLVVVACAFVVRYFHDCILISFCFAAMKFHYHLGQLLYQFCDGNDDVGDTILLTASQINHGKEWIIKDKEMSIDIAELNMKAGKKALDGCDHKTAYSYLMFAVSLLPEDHWHRHYDLSLRLNLLLAGAANSCCQYDEAEKILRGISGRTRCFEDKLSSYFLLSQSKCLGLFFCLLVNLCISLILPVLL